MRKKIVAGNWKMNTLTSEGIELAKKILEYEDQIPSDVQLVIAPPFTHLYCIREIIKNSPIALAAQNCSNKAEGAYTGEVSVKMIASIDCTHVILGHSERREYYGENSEILIEKINLALANNIIPIFCVGENLEEREACSHFDIVQKQIADVLFTLDIEDISKIIIAYEPVWAIGTGKTASSDQAQEIHAFIRGIIAKKFGSEVSENISILYGGSCNPSNAKELFSQKDIDGGLIGGAALKADDFIKIAQSY